MSEDKSIQRGEKARAILESPVWQEAWADFEAFIFEQFRKTESRDMETLAHWKRMHVSGLQLRAFFERTLADGKFAAKELEEKLTRFQRLRRVL